ncbi:hypothetical protein LAZ67_7001169 [Cordylochernes scorpioides]|uniref:Reverse transcriptase domain-containing protein n=1 Tax=Cordylochernes scorpioides TaxID=51811 RepID=A0ABY6KM19_9ARAC|nr:hypothetical protein LAZ67_7001169 [Cordylochernes scorpioides]
MRKSDCSKHIIYLFTKMIPGFSLPRREWVLLNRFRTGQGRCAELMKLWGYTKDPNCACNVPQSMSHILDDCPLYKFNGGISNLHSVTPEALNWLKALPLRMCQVKLTTPPLTSTILTLSLPGTSSDGPKAQAAWFMKSRSTITGMDKIIETILKHKQKELTSLIAIDIAGAFDNAWWPAIIKRMDNDDVPSDLIRIIKSYLNNEREVKFTYESETFYKKLTKGCPQGGPLSPLLWNILLNDLLINFDSMNADIICYADDVTIICWNKTIEGLKTASEYTLNYVIQWCNRNKLTISTEKTNMLYLHNRQKIPIKVNNNIIMPVKQVKILGMKFSNHKWKNKVNFTPHVNDILCKAGRMKNLLCSLSGNMWGLDTEKRLTLFKTIIRPVLTYGSEIWFKYLNNRCKQKLNSMQYQIILWAVRAYKTTSSNCVHSLAKIPLLTDYIESRIIKFDLAQMSIEDLITYEPHAPSIVKSFLHAKMNEIFENTNEIFRSFFVLGIPRFFRPNFYNIQFITDHGNFGKFLATIGAVKEPGCFCGGEIQDARHLLLECPIFRDFRENRFGRIGQLDEFVDKKEKYKNFDQFCKYIYNFLLNWKKEKES